MRRTGDGLAPLMLVGALILLVILGIGAFKKPGYHGSGEAPNPSGSDPLAAPATAPPTRIDDSG